MPSEVVGASVPVETMPLWNRLCQEHGGPSRFVQWVLATLGPAADAGLDERAAVLRAAAHRARMRYLEAEIEAHREELDRLASAMAEAAPVVHAQVVAPPEWWAQASARFGEAWLLEAGERQVRALAERAGADPVACLAFWRARRASATAAFASHIRLRRMQEQGNPSSN